MDLEKLGTFYLGREVDPEDLEPTEQALLYDANDLTTHAVIIGMTGSGKTGLGIDLIEEAALDGVPVLAVDPKGDLGNLALVFPRLAAGDFEPWVDPRAAEQAGVSTAEYAASQAGVWRDGLARWGQGPERLERLRGAAEVAIFTPGSSAGRPLSVLGSFATPPTAVMDDGDVLADRLDATVTGLLTLLQLDADPLTSSEHILLTTVLEDAWRKGRDLSLADLIQAVQDPPVRTLGVMELDVVMPPRDRTRLALQLNNLLAAPGFEAWTRGEPLDVASLLHTPQGLPRISVLSVAHLTDAERMFFLSLLLTEVISWMRGQQGTASLRALLYIDELFGFMPPTAAPPTKKPLLTLLKQARAFGLGVVLSTQNPVDLDYKGLSNTGTWFLGRLQTVRDRARVIEGLRSAAPDAADPDLLEDTLSALPKRTFLLHNVHDRQPVLFQTRWAMSYLAGPLTRDQIRRLEGDRNATASGPAAPVTPGPAAPGSPPAAPGASTVGHAVPSPAAPARVLPADVPKLFAPLAGSADGARYLPFVGGVADVLYISKTHQVEAHRTVGRLVEPIEGPDPVAWAEGHAAELDLRWLDGGGVEGVPRAALPGVALTAEALEGWGEDFLRWIRTDAPLALWRCPEAKLTSEPDEGERDFRVRCAMALRETRDRKREALRAKFEKRMAALHARMQRATSAVERETQQAQQRRMDAAISVGTALLGSFLGRRGPSATRVGSAMRSVTRVRKEAGDVRRAEGSVEQLRADLERLGSELERELAALPLTSPEQLALEPLPIRARSTNMRLRYLGLVWVPYRAAADGRLRPAGSVAGP